MLGDVALVFGYMRLHASQCNDPRSRVPRLRDPLTLTQQLHDINAFQTKMATIIPTIPTQVRPASDRFGPSRVAARSQPKPSQPHFTGLGYQSARHGNKNSCARPARKIQTSRAPASKYSARFSASGRIVSGISFRRLG